MSARILDGKQIASDLRAQIAETAAQVAGQGIVPGLATVLVGENPASMSYIKSKQNACHDAGFLAEDVRLPCTIAEEELIETIQGLNDRKDIHGILVQLPLPTGMDEQKVIAAISPAKDVDGFHPSNLGLLLRGQGCFVPCTPFGVVKMLEVAGIATPGKEVVIVGRSLLVGKPLAALLMQKSSHANATVTVCHSATRDLGERTSKAEILVAAIGRPQFVTADMVADGAVVIDVGINRIDDASRKRGYRLVGDVAYDEVAEKASAITPVPGGVGPMTVTMLMYNTLQSARGLRSQDPL